MNGGDDIGMRKEALRRVARERRAGLDAGRGAAVGRLLAERLARWPVYRTSGRIGIYLAMTGEIDTQPLILQARADGKRLYLPARPAPGSDYDWVEFGPETRLERGPLGIPQPVPLVSLAGAALDLAIVPGLAFDRCGGRLGHGKGIYDRLLVRPAARGAVKIGWAFDFQIWPDIPRTERDIRMDALMTETIDEPAPGVRGSESKEERR